MCLDSYMRKKMMISVIRCIFSDLRDGHKKSNMKGMYGRAR